MSKSSIVFAAAASILVARCANPTGAVQPEDSNKATQPLTIADLNTRHVIGLLGVTLGTVVEADATVLLGEGLGKAATGRYFLSITRIADKPQTELLILPFFSWRPDLPPNERELLESKDGEEHRTYTHDQVSAAEAGYIGRQVHVYVYEIGSFSGIPHLPPGIPEWQDHAFCFSTSLVVLNK